ncbi:hypothetical protein [Streptomyces sp. NBC_01216]|uniref:hypothetical protein n=1 Tax=unclassified Streptomyces TaxID=2593676 RepID=UPI002E1491B6|nr:hypothetical protein OG393_01960 [Streptomyces sp. NBC_01216]
MERAEGREPAIAQRRSARLTVAKHATDAEDLATLLDLLDLHPEADLLHRRDTARDPD